jgi:Tol biopolymer transport system component
VDYRSDQFSFGLMLYEMAIGRKAFARAESVQTMAAIISEEPPPVEARLPAPLRWVIDRCLAKDPAARYESSRDLFRELRNIRDHLSEVSTQVEPVASAAPVARGRWRPWQLAAAFLLGAAIALAVVAFRAEPLPPDQSSYRFAPFSFEPGGQTGAVWSPDGKAVAYGARQKPSGPYQIYVRYLDEPTAIQLTHAAESATPLAWTPDSRRVFLVKGSAKRALWSLAAVGGEPEMVMSLPQGLGRGSDASTVTVSPDGKSVALLRTTENGLEVAVSSPPRAPLAPYAPAPYATKTLFNSPMLRFSPDGTQLLLALNPARDGEEIWLLPYPPATTAAPRRILQDVRSFEGTPTIAWMPDSRHIVFSLSAASNSPAQLWLADTVSGDRHALTSGTTDRFFPAIAPDGRRLIFAESSGHYDIVSVDLGTAAAETLIATERNEWMPAWASTEPALVYVTNRGGPNEIWLHRPGTVDRPIVSPRDFTTGTTWFMAPALSPPADRVVYARVEDGTISRLWISSVAGGAPIQLTNDTATAEFPAAWSPDGTQFTYSVVRDGKTSLMTVRTGGQATPVLVRENRAGGVPAWSPAGDWILDGNELVSPDGKTVRSLGDRRTRDFAFSRDGRLLYGLRPDTDRQVLFSIDVATGAERTMAR